MTKDTEPTRTIYIKMSTGEERIVSNIPGNAKITFARVTPTEGRGYDTNNHHALRIYTTESNQLAVFVGVKEFRDSVLTVKSRTKSEDHHLKEVKGPKGSRTEETAEVEKGWEEDNPF